MKKSKLLEVLGVLSAEEMHRLGLFLQSPYFHQSTVAADELRLFDLLLRYFPDYEAANLEKDVVYKEVYPDSPNVKGKLEKRMSRLLKHIENFMFLEEAVKPGNDFQKAKLVSQFYRRKELRRLYEISLNNLQKRQDGIKRKGSLDLLHEFQVQEEISQYQSLHHNRKHDINLVNTLQSLDNFFLVAKLEYACALLSQAQFNTEVDLSDSLLLLEKLEPLLLDENYEKSPLVEVFTQVFLILQKIKKGEEVDISVIEEFEHLLQTSEAYLPVELLKYFHALCRNFYTWYSNNGHVAIKEKMFNVYREHLEKGYLYYNGGIIPSTFHNMVNIGLIAKEFDWVYTFLQEHKGQIVGTQFPHEVYAFNMANYYLQMKNYNQALDFLVEDYEDFYYQIIAKRIEIKIYFELESELLEPRISAFRFFLRRLSKKKLPEVQREGNNNFINVLKQILSPKSYNNPSRIAKLRDKVTNTAVIKEKEWLLEKLEG